VIEYGIPGDGCFDDMLGENGPYMDALNVFAVNN